MPETGPPVANDKSSKAASIAAWAAFDPQMRGTYWLKSPSRTVGMLRSRAAMSLAKPFQNSIC